MYIVVGLDVMMEIEDVVVILNWMFIGLVVVMLEMLVKYWFNFKWVVLVGYSCGGKVVFGLVLGVCKSMY